MNQAAPAIQVTDLSKSFAGKQVVKNISLDVRRGEIFGFLGPNGSGKTTFLRLLVGLLRPDAGGGTCLGYDILSQSGKIRHHIGYMAQRFSLYEELSVRENLSFMGRIYGVRPLNLKVQAIMERMGLVPFAAQLVVTLSGGWKQRLALAACLLHEPQVLLLDEPTAGVDPQARRDFWGDLYDLFGAGITTLISTHYMDEAERCHRLAYLSLGRLMAMGTPAEIVAQAGLTTWIVKGERLYHLSSRLKGLSGVEQIVPFGDTLHISGRDAVLLEKTLLPFLAGAETRGEQVATGLEDVFIYLIRDGKEN